MGNPRYIKVAEQIKVIVADMLARRIKDPRLGWVTVTDVKVTGDGREATVFYTVMPSAPEKAEQELAGTAAALASANGLIRSGVGKQLGMKFTPTIAFALDAVPETAAEMEALLAEVRAGDEARAASVGEARYAGDPDPYRTKEDDDAGR